jgi:shikimate kinase
VIHLVGPGGAGKSTIAPLVATALGVPCYDLDAHFTFAHGSVDTYIATHGYRAYVGANVRTYLVLAKMPTGVAALSSGFMVYPPDITQEYRSLRAVLAAAPTTLVLLPALELEACVVETVRRQVSRGPGRMPAVQAEAKIRERFGPYSELAARKVASHGPPSAVAAEIVELFRAQYSAVLGLGRVGVTSARGDRRGAESDP